MPLPLVAADGIMLAAIGIIDGMDTSKSILLVEDDASLRAGVCEFLADSGYPASSAGSIREAWAAINASSPTLCVLDVNLPDGSGLDMLRDIVARRLGIRVIVMTAFPLQHLRTIYPARTLVGWLIKPVSPEALLAMVQSAVGQRGAVGQ